MRASTARACDLQNKCKSTPSHSQHLPWGALRPELLSVLCANLGDLSDLGLRFLSVTNSV
jgi:hypothetical protein